MATDAPDPRTFKSWEDAFQYPIPAVRGMEKKLRNNVIENQEKLRSLVGASYRELLGTARAIVTIDERLNAVESGLTDVRKRSDSKVVGKLTSNYAIVQGHFSSEEGKRLGLGSRTILLHSIIRLVSELLSHAGESLVIAKLLVIARLLLKELSESSQEAPILQKLRSRLMSRRVRLLRHIDKRLARTGRDSKAVTKDLAAFSIATSAMPSDVLKHYNRVRLDVLSRPDDYDGQDASGIERTHHYLETIRLARDIFPRRIKTILEQLTLQPLFLDESIQGLKALELSVYGKWVGDDIRNFTPWLRPDELSVERSSEAIDIWAKTALEALANHLRRALNVFDLRRITQTRKELFEIWLGSTERFISSLLTSKSVEILDKPFQERILDIIQTQFGNLHHLPAELDTFLETLESENQKQVSLWDRALLSPDSSAGATNLRDSIVSGRAGRTGGLRRIFDGYEECSRSIEETRKALKEMRTIRWNDYLDDEEGENDPDAILRVLNPNPKEGIEKFLEDKARSTVQNVEASVYELVQSSSQDATKAKIPKVAALLRTLRELRQRLPSLIEPASTDSSLVFGRESLELLHMQLVAHVDEKQLTILNSSTSKFASSPTFYQELWTGNPAVPIQPSIFAFNYLRSLVRLMEDIGPDLWSPDLVRSLKARLSITLAQEVVTLVTTLDSVVQATAENLSAIEERSKKTTRMDGEPGETTENTMDKSSGNQDGDTLEIALSASRHDIATKRMQLLFDCRYLHTALVQSNAIRKAAPKSSIERSESPLSLEQVVAQIETEMEIEPAVARRVRGGAMEYWRRTYLLFGLLTAGN